MVTVIKFNYTNAKNEVKSREVLVMHADDKQFEGIELSYLNDDAKKAALKLLKNHKVGPMPDKRKDPITGKRLNPTANIKGYDAEWNKAWRVFNRTNVMDINPSNYTAKELAMYCVITGKAKNYKSAITNIRNAAKGTEPRAKKVTRKTAYGFDCSNLAA